MTTPFITAIRQLSLATVCVTLVAPLCLAGWEGGLLDQDPDPAPPKSWQEQEKIKTQQLARKIFEKYLENCRLFEAERKSAPQSVEDEARAYIRNTISSRFDNERVLNFEKETYQKNFANIREWASTRTLFSRLDPSFLGDLLKENIISIEECKEALICNAKLAKYLIKMAKAYDEKPDMSYGVKNVILRKASVSAEDKREYQRWREDYARAKKAKADFISTLKADIKNAEK